MQEVGCSDRAVRHADRATSSRLKRLWTPRGTAKPRTVVPSKPGSIRVARLRRVGIRLGSVRVGEPEEGAHDPEDDARLFDDRLAPIVAVLGHGSVDASSHLVHGLA